MSSPFRDAAAVTLDASSRGERARVPGAPINGRFHPPSAVKGLVPRPRLHRKLTASTAADGVGPGPVGLLSAPAGAGKTLLLADWAREYSRASPDADLAWLTLAERDNNVSVLCESLAEAIATPIDPTGRRLPAQTGSRRPVEQWLAHFAETLETHDRRTTLILDDVHTLHDPLSISLLDRILTHTPGNLSIIVAARYEPPLTWHRLALDGRLTRFASTDLAFDRSEITTMFGEYDIMLGEDELAIVEDFTKGWGAVVRLTAAFLAGRNDIADALDEFTHTPRPIADFLVDEVLTSLPEHITSFMLRTSIVDSFSAPLAETLTDSNARSEIDSLIQFNFPVTRTDSADHTTWFSYHPLLREHLRAEFRRVDHVERKRAHVRAATWYESHHLELEALELEISIGDPCRILAFLERCGLGLVLDGHSGDVVRVLESAPTQVSESPITRLILAAAALHSGDVTSATTCLDLLEATHPPIADDPLFLSMSLEISCVSATSDNQPLVSRLQRRPNSTHSDVEAYVHLELATAHLLRREFEKATVEYTQAAALGALRGRSRFVLKSLTGLGYVASLSGDIGAMRAHSTYALDYAIEHRITTTAEYELSASVVAFAAYLCATGDLPYRIPTIGNYRSTDVLGASAPVFGWHTVVTFGLHGLDDAADRRSTAADIRDAMLSAVELRTFAMATLALLPPVVNACLSVGEVEWAGRLVRDAAERFGETSEIHLARGAVAFSANKFAEALAEVSEALATSEAPLLAHHVYAWTLEAGIHAATGHERKSFRSLHKALHAAETGGLLRPFLDYGTALRPIFDEFSGHFGDQEVFAEQVRNRVRPQELVSAPILTPGEYTVLRELASGDTTESIADTLFLSVNTIKTHLRGIYRKLEVSNRRDALKAARRGGLI